MTKERQNERSMKKKDMPGTKKLGMWVLGWQRFKRNKTGMVGLFLVCIVLFVAVFCPYRVEIFPQRINVQESGVNATNELARAKGAGSR